MEGVRKLVLDPGFQLGLALRKAITSGIIEIVKDCEG